MFMAAGGTNPDFNPDILSVIGRTVSVTDSTTDEIRVYKSPTGIEYGVNDLNPAKGAAYNRTQKILCTVETYNQSIDGGSGYANARNIVELIDMTDPVNYTQGQRVGISYAVSDINISCVKLIGDNFYIGTEYGDVYMVPYNASSFSGAYHKAHTGNYNPVNDIIKWGTYYYVAMDNSHIYRAYETSMEDSTSYSTGLWSNQLSDGTGDPFDTLLGTPSHIYAFKTGTSWYSTSGTSGSWNVNNSINPTYTDYRIYSSCVDTANNDLLIDITYTGEAADFPSSYDFGIWYGSTYLWYNGSYPHHNIHGLKYYDNKLWFIKYGYYYESGGNWYYLPNSEKLYYKTVYDGTEYGGYTVNGYHYFDFI